jgi:molecular chaperone GrpE
VAVLEKQLEDAIANLLYAHAETQTFRLRLEWLKQQACDYASTGFARDMLAVRDHLERALGHVPEAALADENVKSFVDGIEATLRELDAVFARQGIVRVEALGQPLDPHKHQAMIEVATDNADPGTIIEEMQSGYMLKDRLLRPALVAVAKAG